MLRHGQNDRKVHRVTCAISEEQLRLINDLCQHYNLSKSDLLRQILYPIIQKEWEEINND